MFKRIDKLQIDLPKLDQPDTESAGVVQELLGGRFGEMSTLNNYMFQSFNFRSKKKLRPFYELIASITAEEFGHVELVSNTINLCLDGSVGNGSTNPDDTPLGAALGLGNKFNFVLGGQNAIPADSTGKPWTGDNVFQVVIL